MGYRIGTSDVEDDVMRERHRQDELKRSGKFLWTCADSGPSYAEKLAVLSEEVGELAREVVEHMITRDKYAAPQALANFDTTENPHYKMPPHREQHFRDRMRSELIQIAAVAQGWAEAIDNDTRTLNKKG